MDDVGRAGIGSARRLAALTLAFMTLGSARAVTQGGRPPQAEVQSFEVASVRPNKSGGFNLAGVQTRPGGVVEAVNVSLRGLIAFAYGLDVYQVVEGTSTLLDDKFDVTATAAATVSPARFAEVGPLNVMMQHLLAERFRLVVRWENRPQPGYALVRARTDGTLGPRMRPSDLECPRQASTSPRPAEDTRSCFFNIVGNELSVPGHRVTDIARLLSMALRRPVIDRTGLLGSYEARMTFDARELPVFGGLRPNPPDSTGPNLPSLFTAVQEQLGLKLEQERLTVPVLIVEHVEPPAEN